ncbi:MAG: hypothetical protein ABR605_04450, partial [Desulfurivibrionaceae bacterium]
SIIIMVYQRVANTAPQGHFLRGADAPLSDAPQGGGVNHGDPGKNDYSMQLQTDKVKFPTKPSRIQEEFSALP